MNLLKCEVCNGNELVKEGGFFVCQHCGCKYAPEEAKKLMVTLSGPMEIVKGNSEMERLLEMADNCLERGIIGEAKRLYTQVTKDFPTEWRGWWGIIKCDPNGELDLTANFENALAFAPNSHRPIILRQEQLYNKQSDLREIQSNLQNTRKTLSTMQIQFKEVEKDFIETRRLGIVQYVLLSIIFCSLLMLLFCFFSLSSINIGAISVLSNFLLGVIILAVVVIIRNVKALKQVTARRNSASKEIARIQSLVRTYWESEQRVQQEISALKSEV